MAVSKRTRFEVLRRDDYTCRYCGQSAPDVKLTVDHVLPVALGGGDDPTNLVAACKDCNAGKSSMSPDAQLVDDVREDAGRWSAAMQLASHLLEQECDEIEEVLERFKAHWQNYLPTSWESTVERLYVAGLPESVILKCADIAINAYGVHSRWAYFCGAANKRLGKMQEMASRIVSNGDTRGASA